MPICRHGLLHVTRQLAFDAQKAHKHANMRDERARLPCPKCTRSSKTPFVSNERARALRPKRAMRPKHTKHASRCMQYARPSNPVAAPQTRPLERSKQLRAAGAARIHIPAAPAPSEPRNRAICESNLLARQPRKTRTRRQVQRHAMPRQPRPRRRPRSRGRQNRRP